MKKRHLLFSLTAMALGVVSAVMFKAANQPVAETSAASVPFYPRTGASGTMLYVNGSGTYFNAGQADLAVYCFNSATDFAWSDRVSYRVYNDFLRVMIPYQNGQAKTWSKFIICRYNPSLEPSVNGFDGVYNQSGDVNFSSLYLGQNTVNISGYDGEGKLTLGLYSNNNYYGITSETHMYLDLSSFPSWEENGAKFAIYFAMPSTTNENRWSQQRTSSGYVPSFCWKVNGQDNDHLYECVVPNIYGDKGSHLWNLAIAVRFSPDATEPGWNNVWNQTQNLSFNPSNHEANMIHVDDWNHAEYDTDHVISKETRLEFYGRYFLDTVTCSSTGAYDATTKAMWDAVDAEYTHHLSRLYQGDIWMLDPVGKDTLIAQAMARYDYILFNKGYSHSDFINRGESEGKTQFAHSVGVISSSTNLTPIIVISSLLLTGGVAFLLFYKRSKKHK